MFFGKLGVLGVKCVYIDIDLLRLEVLRTLFIMDGYFCEIYIVFFFLIKEYILIFFD